MSVNWSTLESQIGDYMSAGSSDETRTPEMVAVQIERLYTSALIGSGRDMYGNFVVSFIPGFLSESLRKAFEFSMNSPTPPLLFSVGITDVVDDETVGTVTDVVDEVQSVADTLGELGIEVPIDIPPTGIDVTLPPLDAGLEKLNIIGINGLILTWLSSKMTIASLPPGFAVVTANVITNGGAVTPMQLSLQNGSSFASELVSAFKIHAKTISGITIGLTPSGSPISLPWVGIL